jgi:hypothetical protein
VLINKEKQREMRIHDRKPPEKRKKAWGEDYWDAEKRIKSIRTRGPFIG